MLHECVFGKEGAIRTELWKQGNGEGIVRREMCSWGMEVTAVVKEIMVESVLEGFIINRICCDGCDSHKKVVVLGFCEHS